MRLERSALAGTIAMSSSQESRVGWAAKPGNDAAAVGELCRERGARWDGNMKLSGYPNCFDNVFDSADGPHD